MNELTIQDPQDIHDCPRCSPRAMTVQAAMLAMDDEDVEAPWITLRYRPFHTEDRVVVLIDTFIDDVVARWGAVEAGAFLDNLLAGPYAGRLSVTLDDGEHATFTAGSLVALAPGLELNPQAIAQL